MSRKISVGVIFGGRSSEHEISIVSAEGVLRHLDSAKYDVIPIGITKDGQWIANGPETVSILRVGKKVISNAVLLPEPGQRGIVSLAQGRHTHVIPIDVFFPVLHGTYGEDGAIQGLFELAGIPYVGCGVLASAVGMDKIIQKQLFQQQRIPVVPYIFFYDNTWRTAQEQTLDRVEDLFHYPFFVKPARLGSSVGVSRVENRKTLVAAIRHALRYDDKIVVEEGIVEAAREFGVGVLGCHISGPRASAVAEVTVARNFLDYAAKYLDPRTECIIPAKIPKALEERMQQLALDAVHAIEGCGMSRVDFLYSGKGDQLYVNEINTIPGFTPTSSYPKLWEAVGMSTPKLLDTLIHIAIERSHRERNITKSFDSRARWHTKVLA